MTTTTGDAKALLTLDECVDLVADAYGELEI